MPEDLKVLLFVLLIFAGIILIIVLAPIIFSVIYWLGSASVEISCSISEWSWMCEGGQ